VRISWSEPAYNGGSTLFGYRVSIKTDSGEFVVNEKDCDGSDQTVKANKFCLLSMTKLR